MRHIFYAIGPALAISGLLLTACTDDEPIPVPDLVGLSGDEARSALADAGLDHTYDAGDENVWNASNWEVESTSPEAGQEVADGTEIVLGLIRPIEEAEIPDMGGMLAGEARSELQDLGFSVEYEADEGSVWDSSNWQVDSTSPEAGEVLEEGSEVTIHVIRSDEYVADHDERAEERAAEFEIDHEDDDLGGAVPGGTTFVRFEISDNFSQGMIASGAQRDTCDALELGIEAEPETGRVAVEGSFPTIDEHGNEDDSTILRAHYEQETLEQINFDNCYIVDVWDLRDGGQIHPDLLENR